MGSDLISLGKRHYGVVVPNYNDCKIKKEGQGISGTYKGGNWYFDLANAFREIKVSCHKFKIIGLLNEITEDQACEIMEHIQPYGSGIEQMYSQALKSHLEYLGIQTENHLKRPLLRNHPMSKEGESKYSRSLMLWEQSEREVKKILIIKAEE